MGNSPIHVVLPVTALGMCMLLSVNHRIQVFMEFLRKFGNRGKS